MKRLSLLWLALTIAVSAAFAAPIDVNRAKNYGQNYVQNTLGRKSADLTLAYTGVSEAGTDALYVFNFENGYVIVAADDRAHPILGYCDDKEFDAENIPEGLKYYLGYYARQIQFAIDNDLPVDQKIAEQWYWVAKDGSMGQTRGEKAVSPLLSTTWDQCYPYNYYAPSCSAPWNGNRCYAGCVATAMSQVMKYWNWPETGVGEHSYSTSSYGGTLSVNFEAATYQWDIMPNSLGSTLTPAAQAVALLMYHCGVSVDMDYAPDGSGSHTEDVPQAVIDYFRYGTCTHLESRDDYTRTGWEDKLIACFDRGFPVIYSGNDDSGGHAFNCDGYNDQRLFHFNWGWSGSSNNYYQIDALNTSNGHFNQNQRVVFLMVPDYIYENMVPAIETLELGVADAMTKNVQISFTVPSLSESGADLQSIEKIELKRNGTLINTFNNPTPGEAITFDDVVSEYGTYEYVLMGQNNGHPGELSSQTIIVGPQCTWKFICQTTNFQGWNGGKVQVVDDNGIVAHEVSMTGSSPLSDKFQMPDGPFTLRWVEPLSTVSSLTINLKNSANQNVYSFTGSSTQLNGTIYTGDNDCQNCTPPTGLTGGYHYDQGDFGTLLTWQCDYEPSNFKIYRSNDGVEYQEIASVGGTVHEYFDIIGIGNYYYKVTAFSSACESTPAQTNENSDYVIITVTNVNEQEVKANIFPNPVQDVLTVQAEDIGEVVIYNVVGQSVYRYKGLTNSVEINTGSFEPGVYTVNLNTCKGQVSRRIIIMH